MNNDIESLIAPARERMMRSHDPIHDLGHAERVINNVSRLATECHRSVEDEQALILAAAWHDVARIITKKTSFIWMPFVDDMISALMLWWYTSRHGVQNSTCSLATRLILCKSVGTGAFLTKFFLKKEQRELVNILKDADFLDAISIERVAKALQITELSRLSHMSYRIVCRFVSSGKMLRMKTEAAKKYIVDLLKQLIEWLREPAIYLWHVEQYGASWAKKNLHRLERILIELTISVSAAA